MKNDFLVGLDVGSKKISLVVGKINRQRELKIIDFKKVVSEGVRQGIIVDLTKAVHSILKLKQSLAIKKINSVFASINGKDIKSHFNQAALNLSPRAEEIRQSHLDRLLKKALSINLPLNRQIIHSIPLEYIVDGEEGISQPLGMTANRIEVQIHIISTRIGVLENLNKVINYSGWEIKKILPVSVACQYAQSHQKRSGVLFLDIGAQTINLGFSLNNILKYSQPFLYKNEFENNQLEQIKQVLEKRNYYNKIKEIVISGGGGLKDGLVERIEKILEKPTKIGIPAVCLQKSSSNLAIDIPEEKEIIDNPVYTVAIGLVNYGLERKKENTESAGGIVKKIKRWMEGYF